MLPDVEAASADARQHEEPVKLSRSSGCQLRLCLWPTGRVDNKNAALCDPFAQSSHGAVCANCTSCVVRLPQDSLLRCIRLSHEFPDNRNDREHKV